MIKVTVLGNEVKVAYAETTDTFANFAGNNGIDLGRQVLSINGDVISPRDFDLTFADKGVEDGSQIRMSAVVKANSAAVKVRFLTNDPKTVITDVNSVMNNLLHENDIDTTRTVISISGDVLTPGELGKTLAELGVQDDSEIRVSAVVKANSAR